MLDRRKENRPFQILFAVVLGATFACAESSLPPGTDGGAGAGGNAGGAGGNAGGAAGSAACGNTCGQFGDNRICCGGRCIAQINDPFNCGGCGKVCPVASPFCDQGSCGATPCTNATCAAGTCCGDTCCAQGTICCRPGEGPIGRPEGDPPYCHTPTNDQPTCNGGCAPLCISDRNLKLVYHPVDPALVLERVKALPISVWRYKTDPETVQHLGPMAQDFRASFGLGDSDRTYNAIDAHGVSLAAIQELGRLAAEQRARLEALERENRELRKRLERLERNPRPLH